MTWTATSQEVWHLRLAVAEEDAVWDDSNVAEAAAEHGSNGRENTPAPKRSTPVG